MNIKFCKWSEEIKILILVIEKMFLWKLCIVYLIMGFYFVIKLMFDDIIRDVLIFFYNYSMYSNVFYFIKCSLGV